VKLLALDTASAQCSVALLWDDAIITRAEATARGHAQRVLPMVDAVLSEASLSLRQLDGIAFGRGPGSFTGVRLAAAMTQGLAFGADLPVLPVSDLAALAEQARRCTREQEMTLPEGDILACMDARMGEVYWAREPVHPTTAVVSEQLTAPHCVAVDASERRVVFAIGMALAAFPLIAQQLGLTAGQCMADAEPHALDVARCALAQLGSGAGWQDAASAQPVYLRNRVV
jgi:tRNA threonylcarbamoyladenosine biosynthesis protein TsaB